MTNRCHCVVQSSGAFAIRTKNGVSSPGTCTVELKVPAFNNSNITGTVSVEVVTVVDLNPYLQHYDAAALPGDLRNIQSPVYGPETLRKLTCGSSNYQQVENLNIKSFL